MKANSKNYKKYPKNIKTQILSGLKKKMRKSRNQSLRDREVKYHKLKIQ